MADPGRAAKPAWHDKHAVIAFAPLSADAADASHSEQNAEPGASAKLPAGQARHDAGPIAPATALKLPAGHLRQPDGDDWNTLTP